MNGVNVSLWAVIVATVVQYVVGAIWYMPIFGTLWGKIHGFDTMDKKTQQAMRRKMAPMMVLQLVITAFTAYVLAYVIKALPNHSAYSLAFWMWFGFVLPTQVSAVIFGGTSPKWVFSKIMIMAGGGLVCLEAAAIVLSHIG